MPKKLRYLVHINGQLVPFRTRKRVLLGQMIYLEDFKCWTSVDAMGWEGDSFVIHSAPRHYARKHKQTGQFRSA